MTEILQREFHDIERMHLQGLLAQNDRNPEWLQGFVRTLYMSHGENPHMFYLAATHLTALAHLDQRDRVFRPQLPPRNQALEAFTSYTNLLAMLKAEKGAPRYEQNDRVQRRLTGSREELAIHAALAYARGRGADFVALPTPSQTDFSGGQHASDVQVFFPQSSTKSALEIQVKFDFTQEAHEYHPRIAVVSLSTALGSVDRAAELRGMLADIGSRDGTPDELRLPKREHNIILEDAADILRYARAQVQEKTGR